MKARYVPPKTSIRWLLNLFIGRGHDAGIVGVEPGQSESLSGGGWSLSPLPVKWQIACRPETKTRTKMETALPYLIYGWWLFVAALGYFVMSSIRIQYRNWEEAGAFKYERDK